MEQLEEWIDVTPDEREAFRLTDPVFHMGITPYYAASWINNVGENAAWSKEYIVTKGYSRVKAYVVLDLTICTSFYSICYVAVLA